MPRINKGKDYVITLGIIIVCFYLIRNKFTDYVNDLNPQAIQSIEKLGFPDLESQKAVIIFSTSWCGVCRGLERDLAKNGIEFHSVDIEKDFNAAMAYERVMGSRSGPVPVSVVGDKYFVGNQSKAISEFAAVKH